MTSKQQIDLNRATEVWEAVSNAAVLNGKDPAEARDEADLVVGWMKAGQLVSQQDARVARRAARSRAWGRWWPRLAGLAAALVVVAGIACIPTYIVVTHANDYAGTDPGSVPAGAAAAIRAWYGQNDLPSNLTLVEQTHSFLYGKKAWLARYEARDGSAVCVYVWGKGNTARGSANGTYTQMNVGCK